MKNFDWESGILVFRMFAEKDFDTRKRVIQKALFNAYLDGIEEQETKPAFDLLEHGILPGQVNL